ncbi:MAG: hypothetical protein N3C63_01355 [Rhodocyclaceae bacterium]|nr:hypothetical protein [Rhodocyclaceae bacterium]
MDYCIRLVRSLLLACVLATGSFAVLAETSHAAKVSISHDRPFESDETLRQWFQEQDRLLDDILLRLSRIENLVRDIFRLIERLPDVAASTRQTAPTAPPAAPIVIAPPPARPSGVWGFFDQWGALLAAAGLLLLLLLMALRRRVASGAATAATPPAQAVLPAPSFKQSAPPAARAAATSPPPQTTLQETAAPSPARPTAATPAQPAPSAAPQPQPPSPAPEDSDEAAEQALELAEIMLSMGLGHGAAQTLIEQIRKEPKQALRHWLKLLEIYRKNGQQEEFQRCAEELRQHFNVQPEDWEPRPEAQRSIADYPHIAARLTELWGKPGCLAYLQNLLGDNRGGTRTGFPQSAAEELLLLSAMIKSGDIPG